ncbi:MAG: DUF1501 domain-containing protein [Rhodobacteraceae bacterium]|nr:DUF1501 domain-containing protein [Paracoccaceae bacterium]
MDRRTFLKSGLIGCSAAASPLMTPITLASAPWEGRLVVIILRGALDGLDAVRPWGDPDFVPLRGELLGRDPDQHAIGNFFGLHPGLAGLVPMWEAGELVVAHAVSTPYRDKRSHFDGQALLEAGNGGDPFQISRDGWLNRLLQIAPDVETRTAFAVGRDRLHILAGPGPHATWSPNTALRLSPQGAQLLELIYHDDPLFRDAALQAMDIIEGIEMAPALDDDTMEDMEMMATPSGPTGRVTGEVARFVVEQLRLDTRIASFSINGWDTHARQGPQITRKLEELSRTLQLMKAGLGPVWGDTAVLVMTEFGRTARVNGTKGTDHGTGGVMFAAGGAVRGGQSYGRWPGLGEADLYQGRDLMPVRDIRAYAGSAMRALFGTSVDDIEKVIFPGLDMGADPGILR